PTLGGDVAHAQEQAALEPLCRARGPLAARRAPDLDARGERRAPPPHGDRGGDGAAAAGRGVGFTGLRGVVPFDEVPGLGSGGFHPAGSFPPFFFISSVSASISSIVVRSLPPVSSFFTPGGRSHGISCSGWPAVTSVM